MSGVLAAAAEAMYFGGVKETSAPVIAVSVVSILLGGLPTLKKGWIALRTFTLNINFLMTVAIIGGAVIGAWPEIALVTFLFALAELIENKALDRARNAVKGLMAMTPDEASVKQPNGSWKVTRAGEVAVGAVVQVKPGERLALDGVVVAGESSVNQAPVTGESVPVDKKAGDKVFAGTINESGVLEFRTTGGKDQTTLAKIIRTVQEAQGSRAPTQRFVDNFARVYTPVVCVAAVLVAVVPSLAFGQTVTIAASSLIRKNSDGSTAGERSTLKLTDINREDTIPIWAHDLDVKPESTYRYRCIVQVYNPFFGRKRQLVPQQVGLSDAFVLASESVRVVVDADGHLVVAGAVNVGVAVAIMAAWCVLFPLVFYRTSKSLWMMTYYFALPGDLPANGGGREPR